MTAACGAVPNGSTTAGGVGTMAPITEIGYERDCYGCASGSLLVLRRDGNASHTLSGKARHGTQYRRQVASIRSEDFEALAQLVRAQGFFALVESYEDPELRDGAWATTRVTHGDQVKQVHRRDEAAPPALKAIEDAIQAWQARTTFAPAGP